MTKRHSPHLHLYSLVAAVIGIAAGIVLGLWQGPAVGVVGGWGVFALVSTVWILVTVWPMDAAATRAHATIDDPGRRVARVLAICGSLISLFGVGIVVVQARHAPPLEGYLLAGIAVVGVAASWGLIQADYTLRYAKLYYTHGAHGIDFNQSEDPEYTDFVYFSVNLGMTYQVSDTNVRANNLRRVVIAQTTLGYLFGAVILATVINLVTSLGG